MAAAAASCGKLLRRYRSHAGLTQEELGDLSGYTANYIGKLERDQRELSPAALERLARILALGDDERAALQAARDRGHRDARSRPLAGRAQQPKVYRIGALLVGNADVNSFRTELREELRRYGTAQHAGPRRS